MAIEYIHICDHPGCPNHKTTNSAATPLEWGSVSVSKNIDETETFGGTFCDQHIDEIIKVIKG